jgi:hypothetical protein
MGSKWKDALNLEERMMPSLLPQLITKLKADSELSALIGTRVYADFIPEDSPKPAVFLYISSEDAEDALEGMVDFAEARIRIECIGLTRESSDDTCDAVRNALNSLLSTSYSGTSIQGISQATGKIHLVDIPNDGTDRWQFRTAQSFNVTYHPF